ncbi:hypothetical protein GW891_01645 [bacterium]|nr:hypothetical protein [bacterium]
MFLKYCNPIIRDENSIYSLDYSNCDLKISVLKDKPRIENVLVNGSNLTRDEINNNF